MRRISSILFTYFFHLESTTPPSLYHQQQWIPCIRITNCLSADRFEVNEVPAHGVQRYIRTQSKNNNGSLARVVASRRRILSGRKFGTRSRRRRVCQAVRDSGESKRDRRLSSFLPPLCPRAFRPLVCFQG